MFQTLLPVPEIHSSDSHEDEADGPIPAIILTETETNSHRLLEQPMQQTPTSITELQSPLQSFSLQSSRSFIGINRPRKEILTGSVQMDSRKRIPSFDTSAENLTKIGKLEENSDSIKYTEVTRTYQDDEGNEVVEKKYYKAESSRISDLVSKPEFEITAVNLDSEEVRERLVTSGVIDTETWARRTMSSSMLNLDSFDRGERFQSVQNLSSRFETVEEFVIEQEIEKDEKGDEKILTEKTYPLHETTDEETPWKPKSFENKDYIVEVTVVKTNANGKQIEETRKFAKDDPAIEDFVANREIVSQQTFSGKFTRTVIEETRSEKIRLEGTPDFFESSSTKISTRLEKEFYEEGAGIEKSKQRVGSTMFINEYHQNNSSSEVKETFKVERSGKIASLKSYSVDQVSIVVKGSRVQEKFLLKSEDLNQVGIFELRVFPNLDSELSEKFINRNSSDYWRLKESGILPKDLSQGQSFSHTEIAVEITVPGTEKDINLEHVYIYKCHDQELLEFLKINNLTAHFDEMKRKALLGITETGDTTLGNEAESSSDLDISSTADVVVVVEHFQDLKGQLFVIVKFQSFMEEKVYKYPADDPELLEMVRNETIPAESLPHLMVVIGNEVNENRNSSQSRNEFDSSSDEKQSENSSDEELIEILNTDGTKQFFKLNDPELLKQVRGTQYEREIVQLRKSASRLSVNSRSKTKKRGSTSQVKVRRRWSSSSGESSSDSSEEEYEGYKVTLLSIKLEERIASDGLKYVHVTKVYQSANDDEEIEVQKQIAPESSKIPKLRQRQAELKMRRRTKSHVDRLDLMPQIEFHLGSSSNIYTPKSPGKRPRLSTTRSERLVESPISKSMSNLQFEDYGRIEAENDVQINEWTFRAEEEITDEGERFVHLFENKYGDEVETIHRADSPTIIELIEAGELPESFLIPASDDEHEQVVQRKFMVKKRQMNENPTSDSGVNQQHEDPLSKHRLRVEDAIDKETGDRLILLTEQFTDERGSDTLNQQIHRPQSPSIVQLVDRGLVPASFLFEEPERDIIEEDEDGFFTENVVKRVYERVYSDFVEMPLSPRTCSSFGDNAIEDLEWFQKKIKPEDFDVCEAEMDVHDVKIIEEFYNQSPSLFIISRRGKALNGKIAAKTTRHRANSPTLTRYLKSGVEIIKIHRPVDESTLAKITEGGHFLPYVKGLEDKTKPYLNVNDQNWNKGKLMSQQSAFLRFQDSELLNQIYQSVDIRPLKGNTVKVTSWLEPINDKTSVVSVDALEQVDLSNQKTILLNKVIKDQDGNAFQEVRSFDPESEVISALVEEGLLPKSVTIQARIVSPYAVLGPESPTSRESPTNKKHRKTSERSELLSETLKNKSPTNENAWKKRTAKTILNIDEKTFPGTVEEMRSEKGDKFLNVTVIEPISEMQNDVHIAKFSPKSVFIDQIVRYNCLPVTLKSALITSEGEIFHIKVPVATWESGKDEAHLIEIVEQEKHVETQKKEIKSSLQKRVDAITTININAKKVTQDVKEPIGPTPLEKDEQIPFDTYDQEVSIKTVKLRKTDLVIEKFPILNEPIEEPEEEETKGSKFISKVLRQFKGYSVSEAQGTPNNVQQKEESWNISDPLAIDVSEIVAATVSVTADENEKSKRVSFYDDPAVKIIFPDINEDFDNFPKNVQSEVDRIIDQKSKKLKDKDRIDEDFDEEIVVQDKRNLESTPVELPDDVYQIRAGESKPKSSGNGEEPSHIVVLRREIRDQDAEESRTYPRGTDFISNLIKDGKLPELKIEEPIDIPAVDWMTSVVEVENISITPLRARPDLDNTSGSSLEASASSSLPVTNIHSSAMTSSPDITNEFESGYESVTPTQSLVAQGTNSPRQLSNKVTPSRVSEMPADATISEEVAEDSLKNEPSKVDVDDDENKEPIDDYKSVLAVNRIGLSEETADFDEDVQESESNQEVKDLAKPLVLDVDNKLENAGKELAYQRVSDVQLEESENGRNETAEPTLLNQGIAFAKDLIDEKNLNETEPIYNPLITHTNDEIQNISLQIDKSLDNIQAENFEEPKTTVEPETKNEKHSEIPIQYTGENEANISLNVITETTEPCYTIAKYSFLAQTEPYTEEVTISHISLKSEATQPNEQLAEEIVQVSETNKVELNEQVKSANSSKEARFNVTSNHVIPLDSQILEDFIDRKLQTPVQNEPDVHFEEDKDNETPVSRNAISRIEDFNEKPFDEKTEYLEIVNKNKIELKESSNDLEDPIDETSAMSPIQYKTGDVSHEKGEYTEDLVIDKTIGAESTPTSSEMHIEEPVFLARISHVAKLVENFSDETVQQISAEVPKEAHLDISNDDSEANEDLLDPEIFLQYAPMETFEPDVNIITELESSEPALAGQKLIDNNSSEKLSVNYNTTGKPLQYISAQNTNMPSDDLSKLEEPIELNPDTRTVESSPANAFSSDKTPVSYAQNGDEIIVETEVTEKLKTLSPKELSTQQTNNNLEPIDQDKHQSINIQQAIPTKIEKSVSEEVSSIKDPLSENPELRGETIRTSNLLPNDQTQVSLLVNQSAELNDEENTEKMESKHPNELIPQETKINLETPLNSDERNRPIQFAPTSFEEVLKDDETNMATPISENPEIVITGGQPINLRPSDKIEVSYLVKKDPDQKIDETLENFDSMEPNELILRETSNDLEAPPDSKEQIKPIQFVPSSFVEIPQDSESHITTPITENTEAIMFGRDDTSIFPNSQIHVSHLQNKDVIEQTDEEAAKFESAEPKEILPQEVKNSLEGSPSFANQSKPIQFAKMTFDEVPHEKESLVPTPISENLDSKANEGESGHSLPRTQSPLSHMTNEETSEITEETVEDLKSMVPNQITPRESNSKLEAFPGGSENQMKPIQFAPTSYEEFPQDNESKLETPIKENPEAKTVEDDSTGLMSGDRIPISHLLSKNNHESTEENAEEFSSEPPTEIIALEAKSNLESSPISEQQSKPIQYVLNSVEEAPQEKESTITSPQPSESENTIVQSDIVIKAPETIIPVSTVQTKKEQDNARESTDFLLANEAKQITPSETNNELENLIEDCENIGSLQYAPSIETKLSDEETETLTNRESLEGAERRIETSEFKQEPPAFMVSISHIARIEGESVEENVRELSIIVPQEADLEDLDHAVDFEATKTSEFLIQYGPVETIEADEALTVKVFTAELVSAEINMSISETTEELPLIVQTVSESQDSEIVTREEKLEEFEVRAPDDVQIVKGEHSPPVRPEFTKQNLNFVAKRFDKRTEETIHDISENHDSKANEGESGHSLPRTQSPLSHMTNEKTSEITEETVEDLKSMVPNQITPRESNSKLEACPGGSENQMKPIQFAPTSYEEFPQDNESKLETPIKENPEAKTVEDDSTGLISGDRIPISHLLSKNNHESTEENVEEFSSEPPTEIIALEAKSNLESSPNSEQQSKPIQYVLNSVEEAPQEKESTITSPQPSESENTIVQSDIVIKAPETIIPVSTVQTKNQYAPSIETKLSDEETETLTNRESLEGAERRIETSEFKQEPPAFMVSISHIARIEGESVEENVRELSIIVPQEADLEDLDHAVDFEATKTSEFLIQYGPVETIEADEALTVKVFTAELVSAEINMSISETTEELPLIVQTVSESQDSEIVTREEKLEEFEVRAPDDVQIVKGEHSPPVRPEFTKQNLNFVAKRFDERTEETIHDIGERIAVIPHEASPETKDNKNKAEFQPFQITYENFPEKEIETVAEEVSEVPESILPTFEINEPEFNSEFHNTAEQISLFIHEETEIFPELGIGMEQLSEKMCLKSSISDEKIKPKSIVAFTIPDDKGKMEEMTQILPDLEYQELVQYDSGKKDGGHLREDANRYQPETHTGNLVEELDKEILEAVSPNLLSQTIEFAKPSEIETNRDLRSGKTDFQVTKSLQIGEEVPELSEIENMELEHGELIPGLTALQIEELAKLESNDTANCNEVPESVVKDSATTDDIVTTEVSFKILADDKFFEKTLPGMESDDESKSESSTDIIADVEIKPVNDAIIQNIEEIGKRFVHLSIKTIKEEGEIVVEYRRYGLDAPELSSIQGDTKNFLEHPEQYIEVTKMENDGTETKQVTRYYRFDDPELQKYLNQTGVEPTDQISKMSHQIADASLLDKSGFLKGSLEYYLDENSNYTVFVKFVEKSPLNETVTEVRNYLSQESENFTVPISQIDMGSFTPFKEQFYELDFSFSLANQQVVRVKRWSPISDSFFAHLMKTEFPDNEKLSEKEKSETLKLSRPVKQPEDFLLQFVPSEVRESARAVCLEINPVSAVRVKEHRFNEKFNIVDIDIILQTPSEEEATSGRKNRTNEKTGIAKRPETLEIPEKNPENAEIKVVRHRFYSTVPEVTTLKQKRLIYQTRKERKVIGILFEVQKTTTDILDRRVSKTSRYVNPGDEVINSHELRPMNHLLKLHLEEFEDERLHTKNPEVCPKIDTNREQFRVEAQTDMVERISLEEKYDQSGNGERTISRFINEQKLDCIVETRSYKSSLKRILIETSSRSNADVEAPKFYEFTIIQKKEAQVVRNRVWIPTSSKLPNFLTDMEELPIAGNRKFIAEAPDKEGEETAVNVLFSDNLNIIKAEHLDIWGLIDANRMDILDFEELTPRVRSGRVVIEVRPVISMAITEFWDGETRWVLKSRKMLEYDKVYTLTSFLKVKTPSIKKIRKSTSMLKIFGSSVFGSRRVVSRKSRSKSQSDLLHRQASKLYLAMHSGLEKLPTFEVKKKNLESIRDQTKTNVIEIKSRSTKLPEEEKELESDEEENLETIEPTPIGISVKQIRQNPMSKVVIFEGTSRYSHGNSFMERRTYRSDDPELSRALEEDPTAIVLPLDPNDLPREHETVHKGNVEAAPLTINVRGSDGSSFLYRYIDGKVMSDDNLDTIERPNVEVSLFEPMQEMTPIEFDLTPKNEKTDERKRSVEKVQKRVLKIVRPGSEEQLTLEEAFRRDIIDSDTYLNLKQRNSLQRPRVYDPVTAQPMRLDKMEILGVELPPTMRRIVHHDFAVSESSLVSWDSEELGAREVSADQVVLAQQPQGVSKFDKNLDSPSIQHKAIAITLPQVKTLHSKAKENQEPILMAEKEPEYKARISKKVTVLDPVTEERISLEEGLRRGLFDEKTYQEFKKNEQTESGVPVSKEEYRRLIKTHKPVEIMKEVELLYFPEVSEVDFETQCIQDLVPEIEVQKAVYVENETITSNNSKKVTPEEAYKKGLIDHSTYCNFIEYDTSVELVTISTSKTVPVKPPDDISSPVEYKNKHSFEQVTVLDPVMEVMELESESPVVFNPQTKDLVSPTSALNMGLIDQRTFSKLMFEVTSVLEDARLLSSVNDTFALKISVLNKKTGKKLRPRKAFEKGLINAAILDILENSPTEIQFLSTKSDLWQILIFECISENDDVTQISFDDALELGIIDSNFYVRVFENAKHKPKMTSGEVPEGVRVQFEETKSNDAISEKAGIIVVTDSETGITLNLDDAFNSGLIEDEKYKELKDREKAGIRELEVSKIDGKVFVFSSQTGETFSVEEAFTRGWISLPVYERLTKGKDKSVRNQQLPRSIMITDSSSNKQYTIEEALERKLISQKGYADIISKYLSTSNAPIQEEALVAGAHNRKSFASNLNLTSLQNIATSSFATSHEVLNLEFSVKINEIELVTSEVLPTCFNLDTKLLEQGAEKVQMPLIIPGAISINDRNGETSISMEEAIHQKILSEQNKTSLMAQQYETLQKIVSKYLNKIMVKDATPNDDKVFEQLQASDQKISEEECSKIREQLLTIVNKNRIQKTMENQGFLIYNSKTGKTQESKNHKILSKKIDLTFYLKDSNKLASIDEFYAFLEHIPQMKTFEIVENLLSILKSPSTDPSYLFIYSEHNQHLSSLENAIASRSINVQDYLRFLRHDLQNMTFVSTDQTDDLFILPTALSQGIITDKMYYQLTQTVNNDSRIDDFEIHDPFFETTLKVSEAFQQGKISSNQLKLIILLSTQNPETTGKIFIIDRDNDSVISPFDAIELNLLGVSELDSLVLTNVKSFEKISPPGIHILNPENREIFTLETSLELGFTNIEVYEDLCSIAYLRPQSVPKLLVMLEDSKLVSPIAGYLDGIIDSNLYENIKTDNIDYLLSLKPSQVTVMQQSGTLSPLELVFKEDLIDLNSFANLLALMSEDLESTPSFLILNPSNGKLLEIREAVQKMVVEFETLSAVDPNILMKYKYSDTQCFIPGKKLCLLKEALTEHIIEMKNFIQFLIDSETAEAMLIYDETRGILVNQSEASNAQLFDQSDLVHFSISKKSERLILFPETQQFYTVEDAQANALISSKSHHLVKAALHESGKYMTQIVVWSKSIQNILSTYEAVFRETITKDLFYELSYQSSEFCHILPNPEIELYSLKMGERMSISDAVLNRLILPENVALLLEKLETEPEIFPKTLIIHATLQDVIVPLDAVESGLVTRNELEQICDTFQNLRIPFKDTGLYIWLSLTKMIIPIFEALHEKVISSFVFMNIVQKLKFEPELLTKLLVLDENTENIFTPLIAVDLEVMEVSEFDEILSLQPELIQPVKSTGIYVLSMNNGDYDMIENCVLNGTISLESYSETLRLFKENGVETRKTMLYFPDSDELLTIDKAMEENYLTAEDATMFVNTTPGLVQPAKYSGIFVLLMPEKLLVTLEECLNKGDVNYDTFLEILSRHYSNAAKLFVLQVNSDIIMTIDDALMNRLVPSETYKDLYDRKPDLFSDEKVPEMFIMDADSGKIVLLSQSVEEKVLPQSIAIQTERDLKVNPFRLRKLMIYSARQEKILKISEAKNLDLVDDHFFEELLSTQPDAFEYPISSKISIAPFEKMMRNNSELSSLENSVLTGELDVSVFDEIERRITKNPLSVTNVMINTNGNLTSLSEAFRQNLISQDIFDSLNASVNGEKNVLGSKCKLLDEKSKDAIDLWTAFTSGVIDESQYQEMTRCEREFPETCSRLFVLSQGYKIENLRSKQDLEAALSTSSMKNIENQELETLIKPIISPLPMIFDIDRNMSISVFEALERELITVQMSDSLCEQVMKRPEKLTKVLVPDRITKKLWSPLDALEKGKINQTEFENIKLISKEANQFLKIPDLKVYNDDSKAINHIYDLIMKTEIEVETLNQELHKLTIGGLGKLRKMLIYMPSKKSFSFVTQIENEILIETERAEIIKLHPETIESYLSPSNVYFVNDSSKVLPMCGLLRQEVLTSTEYEELTEEIGTMKNMHTKIFVKTETQEGQIKLNNLSEDLFEQFSDSLKYKLKNYGSLREQKPPSGLTTFNPSSNAILPLEKAIKNNETKFQQVMDEFEMSPEDYTGILIQSESKTITDETELLWPTEALSSHTVEASQIRDLQRDFPEVFQPQKTSGVTLIDVKSENVLPLEASFNLGLITFELFNEIVNKVDSDESFGTNLILFDNESKRTRKIPVATICFTMAAEDYATSFYGDEMNTEVGEDLVDGAASKKTDLESIPEIQEPVDGSSNKKLVKTLPSVKPKTAPAVSKEKKGTKSPTVSSKLTTPKKQPVVRRLNDEPGTPSKTAGTYSLQIETFGRSSTLGCLFLIRPLKMGRNIVFG